MQKSCRLLPGFDVAASKCQAILLLLLIFSQSYSLRAEKGNSKSVQYVIDMAEALVRQHKVEEAETIYTKAIAKFPREVALYYMRGKIRGTEYLGRCDIAIHDLTIAIKLDINYNPKAFWRRGACYEKMNQYALAIRDYTDCLTLMPNYDRVFFMRGKAYGKLGMIKEAAIDLKRAAELNKAYRPAVRDILTGKVPF